MHQVLRIALLALCAATPSAPVIGQRDRVDPATVERVLLDWTAAWRSGRIRLEREALDGRRPHPVYRGLLPATARREGTTHRTALAALLATATAHADAAVAERIVGLIATTLESGLQPTLHPHAVRSIALDAAAALSAPAAIHRALQLATEASDRGAHPRARPAAVLVLGRVAHPVARAPVDAALVADDRLLRLAAADALFAAPGARSAEAAAEALYREADPGLARLLASIVERGLAGRADELGAARFERTIGMAAAALGRHGGRTDLSLIRICEASRCRAAIPPLIELLERIQADPDPAALTQVRDRTQVALRSLTGAILPADRPDQWREFWMREGPNLQVPKARAEDPRGRTSSGFFGIPVEGDRVLFLIDASGSMQAAHSLSSPRTSAGVLHTTRLDAARIELMRSIEALPDGTRFGVIAFADGVVRMTDGLLAKSPTRLRSVRESTDRLRAAGGTNIWGALAEALDLDGVDWDDTTPAEVDEIFLLSDGAPSVGDVIETDDILGAVRTANRLRGVRIHTVYLGDSDSSFMQQLAADHDGSYVRSN